MHRFVPRKVPDKLWRLLSDTEFKPMDRAERTSAKVYGEMAEWFKAAVLKTAVGVSLPWVRIPLSPPDAPRP